MSKVLSFTDIFLPFCRLPRGVYIITGGVDPGPYARRILFPNPTGYMDKAKPFKNARDLFSIHDAQ